MLFFEMLATISPFFLLIQLSNCNRIHFNLLSWVSEKMHCISVLVNLRLNKSFFFYDLVKPQHKSASVDCDFQPTDFPSMLTIWFTGCSPKWDIMTSNRMSSKLSTEWVLSFQILNWSDLKELLILGLIFIASERYSFGLKEKKSNLLGISRRT